MKKTGWGTGMITLVLYPFGAGAMALNVYFASLILSWFDVPVITPVTAIFVALPLGLPVTWIFACHIRQLMNQSEAD